MRQTFVPIYEPSQAVPVLITLICPGAGHIAQRRIPTGVKILIAWLIAVAIFTRLVMTSSVFVFIVGPTMLAYWMSFLVDVAKWRDTPVCEIEFPARTELETTQHEKQ